MQKDLEMVGTGTKKRDLEGSLKEVSKQLIRVQICKVGERFWRQAVMMI